MLVRVAGVELVGVSLVLSLGAAGASILAREFGEAVLEDVSWDEDPDFSLDPPDAFSCELPPDPWEDFRDDDCWD